MTSWAFLSNFGKIGVICYNLGAVGTKTITKGVNFSHLCHSELAKNLVIFSKILHFVQDDTRGERL